MSNQGRNKEKFYMAVSVDIKKLLEAGLHFGHKTSRWHPKMAPYIHSKRQDSHIIDLTKTAEGLERALAAIEKVAASGKPVLLVGTKKQAGALIREVAEKTEQPFVADRWIGGTLTNVATVSSQIKKLTELEKKMASGEFEKRYNKLEVQRFQEEIDDLNQKYGGVKKLSGKPGMVVGIDMIADSNAVREAQKLHIPVVALVDTNADPTGIDYVIPANDDAIKGIKLILDYVAQAIEHGASAKKHDQKETK